MRFIALAALLAACGPLVTDRADDEGLTPLMRASQRADTAAVVELLAKATDVNATVSSMDVTGVVNTITGVKGEPRSTVGYSALTFAARRGRVGNARLLIAHGADVKRVARGGDSPLSLAIARNDVEMTRLLMQAGARPDPRQLGVAIARAKPPTIEALLRHGANPNASGPPNQWMRPLDFLPLLIIATQRGDPAVVRVLLAAGARPDVRDRFGWTALRWAHDAKARKVEGAAAIIALLDSVGARDTSGIRANDLTAAVARNDLAAARAALAAGADPQASDAQGIPAVVHAAARGQTPLARALIDAGADVNVKGPYSPTPLVAAIDNGDVALVTVLLAAGARADLMDSRGILPLTASTRQSNPEFTALLLADTTVSVPDAALQNAVSRGDSTQVAMLLRRGANAKKNNGFFMYTAARGCGSRNNLGVIRMLLDHGANPDGWQWGPPLVPAAAQCGPEVVQLLIERGADVNRKHYNGMTPLMSASYTGRLDNIRLLLAAGAKLNATTGGLTALSYARTPQLRQELIKLGARGDTTKRRTEVLF
jgi:ankyrin repeat protein